MKKRFECACRWAFHNLCVEIDEKYPEMTITVVNAPRDYSFPKRLKAAWSLLFGRGGDRNHIMSEIVFEGEEAIEEFVDTIVNLCEIMLLQQLK